MRERTMSRRQVLGIGGALGLMAVTELSAAAVLSRRPATTGAELHSAVPLPAAFTVPLPLPQVLRPAGADRYEITQRETVLEILPGIKTPLWTYNGAFPGPTIEARRGRPVTVTHHNELPVPTVVHLHGGRTPPESDGYPTDLVLPDGWRNAMPATSHVHGMQGKQMPGMSDPRAAVTRLARDYTFPMHQRPALLWYHDHRMDFTAPAIWRGSPGCTSSATTPRSRSDCPRGRANCPSYHGPCVRRRWQPRLSRRSTPPCGSGRASTSRTSRASWAT